MTRKIDLKIDLHSQAYLRGGGTRHLPRIRREAVALGGLHRRRQRRLEEIGWNCRDVVER